MDWSRKDLCNIERQQVDVLTVSGTRKFHAVRGIGQAGVIKSRSLSCYCTGCLTSQPCLNASYIASWEKKDVRLAHEDLRILLLPIRWLDYPHLLYFLVAPLTKCNSLKFSGFVCSMQVGLPQVIIWTCPCMTLKSVKWDIKQRSKNKTFTFKSDT